MTTSLDPEWKWKIDNTRAALEPFRSRPQDYENIAPILRLCHTDYIQPLTPTPLRAIAEAVRLRPVEKEKRCPSSSIPKAPHPFLPSLGDPAAIEAERARHQDIRPLEVAIIRILMADKLATERRKLAAWLGNTMLQVNPDFRRDG